MEHAQRLVDTYFESAVTYWNDVYHERDLASTVYQRRNEETLKWVAGLNLAPSARVIDIGCGTGSTAVGLARMGFLVCALDRVPGMLEHTRKRAQHSLVAEQVTPMLGNVCALDFPDETFDLTLALGLLPWVSNPDLAVIEMIRVTKPGGRLILSNDNSWRLNYLLDPLENPIVVPFRRRVALRLRSLGLLHGNGSIAVRMHSVAQFDRFLRAHGLEVEKETTIGFGPFTFLRYPLFRDPTAIRLHQRFQTFGDRKMPLLRAMGAHHLVLVRRSDSPSRSEK